MTGMHSLRTKITVLTVCITVFAVAVVTLLSVVFIRNTEHRKSDQLLLLLCETGERNLDYYFNSVETSLDKVEAFIVKDLNGTDDEELAAHVERVRTYFEEAANKTNGVLTFYYRIDPEVSQKAKGFWYTNLDGRGFTEHEVTEITEYDTEDTEHLIWFTVPKKTGSPIWLPPYDTENLNMRVISYNIPVHWRGRFIGVIGIELDYSVMKEQVGSIKLYRNGYAFLTDAQGNLIYHPRIDEDEEEKMPQTPEGLMSGSTFLTYTFENEKKEAAWLKLGNGMRLYVSVPEKETDGDWEQLVRTVLFAGAAVILLTVLMSWLVSAHITGPLKQLTEAAKEADQGNYDFALKYNGKDEIGTLTKTFARMSAHIREHISDLNKRVYVDSLTSVRNKGAFTTYMEDLQAKLEEDPDGTEFAVGMFDCDDLKLVNDEYGHDKGDAYLKTASRIICKVFQHSPVFRIGGDEFAVVLRNEDLENRDDLLRAFDRAMEETCVSGQHRWEQVHVARGISVYDPQQDRSVTDTMRRADKIMYANKRKYKNVSD